MTEYATDLFRDATDLIRDATEMLPTFPWPSSYSSSSSTTSKIAMNFATNSHLMDTISNDTSTSTSTNTNTTTNKNTPPVYREYLMSSLYQTNPGAMEEQAKQSYIIGDNLRIKGFYEDAIVELTKALTIQEVLLVNLPSASEEEANQQDHNKNDEENTTDNKKKNTATTQKKKNDGKTKKKTSPTKQQKKAEAASTTTKKLEMQEQEMKRSTFLAKIHYGLGLAYRATKEYKQSLLHLDKAASTYGKLQQVQKKRVAMTNKKLASKQQQKENENGTNNTTSSGTASTSTTLPKNNNNNTNFYKQELLNCNLNMARTYHGHGVDFQRKGEYTKSIKEHSKAIAIFEKLLGRSHLETARSYYMMGCALSDRGDFDIGLAELRKALRTRLLVLGYYHQDVKEVVHNIGTVLLAQGSLTREEITNYMNTVLPSLSLEMEGDYYCRKQEFQKGIDCYRKALSMEEQCLGDLHPTTCELYLRLGDATSEMGGGDTDAILQDYKSAISISERLHGKFHVKVGQVYDRLATVLMMDGPKQDYATALSFFSKAYAIYEGRLGSHHVDTIQAMMNVRLAAAMESSSSSSSTKTKTNTTSTSSSSGDWMQKAKEEIQERKEEEKEIQNDIWNFEEEIYEDALFARGGDNNKRTKRKKNNTKNGSKSLEKSHQLRGVPMGVDVI